MKKLFLFGAMLLVLPHLSFAAPIAEDFDSYVAGADLNGGAGGFGWAGNWATLAANEVITPNAPAGMSGKAMKMLWISDDAGGGSRAITSIDPTTSGEFIVSFQMMAEQTNKPGRFGTNETGIVSRCFIRFDSDGNIHSLGATDSILQPYTANQVYRILIKIGHVPGKFAVSIDGGAYSADQALGGSSPYTISGVAFADETLSAANFWVDDISITTPTPPPTNTVNRLAKFITSTTIGDALFSDDGTNTTLTSGNLFLQIGSAIDSITNGVLNFGTTLATTMNFGRAGQKMIINSDVGIGTATPTEKLDVNGGIFSNFIHLFAGGLVIDTDTAGALSIGQTNANSVQIGGTGITTTVPGTISVGKMTTVVNCSSSASPAICDGAPSGSVALPNGGTTLVVNTTAVTANSQIFIQEDSSLGARFGITCNTGTGRNYVVNSRTPSTSFTIKSSGTPVANKACLSYWVVN